MPESVTYDSYNGFVLVNSFDNVSIEDFEDSLREVIEINKRTNCARVLVDVRKQKSLPETVDIYVFGEDLPDDIRFAIVKSEINSMDMKFLQSTGARRGKSIKIFDDIEVASKWLSTNFSV